MMTASIYVDPKILGEAADWLIRLHADDGEVEQREQFEQWRRQSPQHQAAWQRAEAMLSAFGHVPIDVGRNVLGRLDHWRRRDVLRSLGGLLVAGPAVWLATRELPWHVWIADFRTAAGEQRRVELTDGTQLVLNTASAVDIIFSANERRLNLHTGEILITTARDSSPRPFLVETAEGYVKALGARFSVRQLDNVTRVSVFDASVEVTPQRAPAVQLHAGDAIDFDKTSFTTKRVIDAAAAFWEKGLLVARNMQLGDLIAELNRYQRGVLRCNPRVATLPVSGAFSLRDIDASLALLEKTLPIRIQVRAPYWRLVEPR